MSSNEAGKRKYMQLNVYVKAKARDKLRAKWHNDAESGWLETGNYLLCWNNQQINELGPSNCFPASDEHFRSLSKFKAFTNQADLTKYLLRAW